MKLDIKLDGLAEAQARLRGLAEGKIQAATVAALNDAARAGHEAARAEMSRVFDRPTPWVLGGIRYVKATKDRLQSQVDFDFWGNKQGVSVEQVLAAEVQGGQRRFKRHEIALQRAGILPPGMHIVPVAGAELDAYGNMKASQIVQIIAWFRGFGEQGYRANMLDKTKARRRRGGARKRGFEYFAVRPGDAVKGARHRLAPGIYQRSFFGFGQAIKPVMLFIRPVSYARRFDFYRKAGEAALPQFEKSFSAYLDRMLKERGL